MTDIARDVGDLLRGLDQLCQAQPNASSAEHRLTVHLMRMDMRDTWAWVHAHPEAAVANPVR